jgi:hypothetical protein
VGRACGRQQIAGETKDNFWLGEFLTVIFVTLTGKFINFIYLIFPLKSP